ncbi:MAG: CDP-diacylglycerol--glycerol-3-phosphate 3-phosphatidyltransferase [Pirellulaceae bacterium]|nr:CDP-diacylglycerol--glycerol-3-phosphate 3-phosphatidyltransferase [Pirellulaceae bacterium]
MDSNSVDDKATTTNQTAVLNTPNLITLTRFALSIVVFVLMSYRFYDASFWIFVIAASTDWVDGYIARRTNQVTQLGRILDPFCDKMIICGVYILIAIEAARMPNPHWSLITGWMAVVVVGRELLVTMLRGYIEQHGGDFSASKSGKIKMVFQCIAVGGCLLVLAMNGSTDSFAVLIGWITGIAVWLAIVSTIYSGIIYIFAATKMVQELTKHTNAT